MESVKRYGHIGTLVDAVPRLLEIYPSMVVYVRAADFDRVTAECYGLQLSLTTADQTIDDLQTAIVRRNQRIDELYSLARGLIIQGHARFGFTEHHPDCIRDLAALKPTAEAESQ
jgi:hypothetical protein